MSTYDILDETSADENLLSPYARKKARHTGFWMIVSAGAGLILFGSILFTFFTRNGHIRQTEDIVAVLFLMCMIIKYALLLMSGIQIRMGAVSLRSHLLHKAAFNSRIVWIFVGILALVFLLQAVAYLAFGWAMFGEITSEFFNVY